jgi:hypothetical protein
LDLLDSNHLQQLRAHTPQLHLQQLHHLPQQANLKFQQILHLKQPQFNQPQFLLNLLQQIVVPIPTITAWAFVFVIKAVISVTAAASQVFNAVQTLIELLMDLVLATQDILTIVEFARCVLKVHSGVHQSINASSFAVKILLTQLQLRHVFAIQDMDFSEAHANLAP